MTRPDYNKEVNTLRCRRWREANREKRRVYMREYVRKWKKANRDKCNRYKRNWQAVNGEREKEVARKWREANKERVLIGNRKRNRKYAARHPEIGRMKQQRRRVRERNAKPCDKVSANLLCQLISSASRLKCGICGKNMPKNDRSIDHIVPLAKGGSGEIWNLRIVHIVCNARKQAQMPDELNFSTP